MRPTASYSASCAPHGLCSRDPTASLRLQSYAPWQLAVGSGGESAVIELGLLFSGCRYFDDDYENAAMRCYRCGGAGHQVCNSQTFVPAGCEGCLPGELLHHTEADFDRLSPEPLVLITKCSCGRHATAPTRQRRGRARCARSSGTPRRTVRRWCASSATAQGTSPATAPTRTTPGAGTSACKTSIVLSRMESKHSMHGRCAAFLCCDHLSAYFMVHAVSPIAGSP